MAMKDDLGFGGLFDALAGALKEELNTQSKNNSEMISDSIGDTISQGVTGGIQKATTQVKKNSSKYAGEVGKIINEEIGKISKSFRKLNDMDFNISSGKGKNKQLIDISSALGIKNGVSDVVNQLDKQKSEILEQVRDFYISIQKTKDGYNKYNVKSDNSILSVLNSGDPQDIVKAQEKAYDSLIKLQEKYGSMKIKNNSDLSSKKEALFNLGEQVKLVKQIKEYSTKLGVSNEKYESLSVANIANEANKLAESIRKQGVSDLFEQELSKCETVCNKFIDIATRMYGAFQNNNSGDLSEIFAEMDIFIEGLSSKSKAATEEVKVFNEELKNAERYIDESKKTVSSLNKATKATFDKPPKRIGTDVEKRYQYVGEVANLLKNTGDAFAGHPGVEYFERLCAFDPELKKLADTIRGIHTDTMPINADPKKIEEETENRKRLNAELERAKELGVDTSHLINSDVTVEEEKVDALTESLKRLNDEKERGGKVGTVGGGTVAGDTGKFAAEVSRLENFKHADPEWIKDYTDKIRKGEITLSDALDEYKNKLATKMQEIVDEQNKNKINNENLQLFINNFGDPRNLNLDTEQSSKYVEILNQISIGALNAADGIEQFNAVLNKTQEKPLDLKDNTAMSYDEKIEKVKELISYQKTLARFEELEEKSGYEELDSKEESEYFRLQDKLLEAGSDVEDFRASYKGLKLELKDGSAVTATADSLERLAGIKPGNIKNITMEYTNLHSSISNLDKMLDVFDGGLATMIGSDALNGNWGDLVYYMMNLNEPIKELKNSFNMTEQEATEFYNKIKLLDKNLWTNDGKITSDNSIIKVLNEVAEIAQNKYKEVANSVKTLFEEAERQCIEAGQSIEAYIDYASMWKEEADRVVNAPLMKQELSSALPLSEELSVDGFTKSLTKLDNLLDNKMSLQDFFRGLSNGKIKVSELSAEIQELLQSIQFLDKNGNIVGKFLEKNSDNNKGLNNFGVLLNNQFATILRDSSDYNVYGYNSGFGKNSGETYIEELINKMQTAQEKGVQLAKILQIVQSSNEKNKDVSFEIQQLAKGSPLFTSRGSTEYIEEQNNALLVQDEHLQKLIKDYMTLDGLGFSVDGGNSANFMYDKNNGFSFIDLGLKNANEKAESLDQIVYHISNVMTGGHGNYPGMLDEDRIENTIALLAKVKNAFLEIGYSSQDIDSAFLSPLNNNVKSSKMLSKINQIIEPNKVLPDEVYDRFDRLNKDIKGTETTIRSLERQLQTLSKSTIGASWTSKENAAPDVLMSELLGSLEFSKTASSYEKQFGELPHSKNYTQEEIRSLVDKYNLSHKNYEVVQKELESEKEKLSILNEQREVVKQQIITGQTNQQEAQQAQETAIVVEQAEEKKRKLRLASLSEIPKLAKQEQQAYEQVADSAEKSADRVVAAENKKEEKIRSSNGKWGKITTLRDNYDSDPFSVTKQKVEETKTDYRTTVEMWGRNDDGDFELQTVKIIKDMDKLSKNAENTKTKIAKAQAALKNFIATFDNKTLGQGSQLSGYDELSKFNIVNVSDIEIASTKMKQLDAEYNKVVQDFRKGSSSMNPFVNAINNTTRMGTVIESLFLDYQGLKVQTDDVGESLLALDMKYQDLMSADNIYNRAKLFGELKVAVNEVTDAIRIQRKEEALSEKQNKSNSKALLLNEKKNNKVNELVKLENQLVSSGKMTDDVRQKLDSLFERLTKVSDTTGLSIWNEQLKQFISSIDGLPQHFEFAWNEVLAKINKKQGVEIDRLIGTGNIQKTIEKNLGIGLSATSTFKDSFKGTEWTGALADESFGIIEQYNNIISKIKEITELRKSLRKLENDTSGNNYSEYIEQTRASISALISELRPLMTDGFFTNNADILGQKRIQDFAKLYDNMEIERSKIETDRQNRELEAQKQAIIRSVEAKKQVAGMFNEALKGEKLDGADFKFANIDKNGNATLTFLEIIGDKAVETKVHIDDILVALQNLENGTFSVEGYKTSYKTRNVTQDDFSGINQNDGIQAKIDAYNQLSKTEKQYQELKVKVDNNAASSKEKSTFEELTKLREYYNKVIEKTIELEGEEKLYYESIGKAAIEKEKSKYDKKKLEQQGRYNVLNGIYQERIDSPEIKNALSSTEQLMNSIKNNIQVAGFGKVFDDAQKEVEELNAALRAGTIDTDAYSKSIQDIANSLNNTIAVVDPSNIKSAEVVMRNYVNSLNGAKIKSFDEQTGKMIVTVEEGKGVIRELTFEYNSMNGQIVNTKNVTKESEGALKSFFNMLKGKGKALMSYLATFASFYRIISIFRQGITYIRELDTALTEMRKVSDETVSSLRKFQNESFDVASSIGTTAKEIQNSSADFMRLGYSLKEASELAQDANIYANVGDMEIDEATEHMISSIKAWGSEFNSEVEASGAIVDRYNEIGNNFAITSADIGSAMERSAAALKAGGNTLNEALGLITAGNLIQQDADTTANALKVMSLRIRGSKTDLEEMGEETDGLASSTSKLREEIKALSGVDIMKDENTYKSTAEIIQEIGAVYDNLSDVSKASLLEKLAGKTRASTVAGLLENYKTIGEVIESAENADGSAIEENIRYMESIEGKISKFTNEVQEFWHNLIDSNTVKGFVDVGTSLIGVLADIVDVLGEIGTLGAVVGAAFSVHLFKNKNSGGRVKVFTLIAKYATESFSREVCEFWCISE